MKIARHPQLEDYFFELDCSDLRGVDTDRLAHLYERGTILQLKGLWLDFDRKLVQSVTFPSAPKELKKFRTRLFTRPWPLHRRTSALLRQRVFAGDDVRLRAFREQVRRLNAQIDTLLTTLFPRYRWLDREITWRLSETRDENLHVDVYREDMPHHHVRLFVNLDDEPRVWNTSWTLDQLVQDHLHRLDPGLLRTATAGRLAHDLNFAVFGPVERAGQDGQPRHTVEFGPGEAWLVDGRKISHQIVRGRRLLATDFAVDVPSMRVPGSHYFQVIERHRRRLLAATAAGGVDGSLRR